jgi:hypothetical protein
VDREETQAFELPPDETGTVPVSYRRAEAHYFGLAPHLLVLALAALAVGAGIGLLAAGHLWPSVVLLAVGALGVAFFLEQARRRRESYLEVALADGVDRVRVVSGFAASAAASWSRAGREVARARIEQRRLERERAKLRYELGKVVHRGDDAERDRLLAELHALDERLAECARRAHGAVTEASSRVEHERLAVASTRIVRPDDPPR